MINDLVMLSCPVKFVNDTTVYELYNQDKIGNTNKLQESANFAISWSSINHMKLNPVKCKEIIINISKFPDEAFSHVVIENMIVERVTISKEL